MIFDKITELNAYLEFYRNDKARAMVGFGLAEGSSRLGGISYPGSDKPILSDTVDKGNITNLEFSGRGTQQNAFRHTIWQATTTSQLGAGAAEFLGNAHETGFADLVSRYEGGNRVYSKKPEFSQVDINNTNDFLRPINMTGEEFAKMVDSIADQRNNRIGQSIGSNTKLLTPNSTPKNTAAVVANYYATHGLYTAKFYRDDKGHLRATIERTKISATQLNAVKNRLPQLDNFGNARVNQQQRGQVRR
jgi:hypothetical protein